MSYLRAAIRQKNRSMKREYLKMMEEFEEKNRSSMMNLLTHHFGIPRYDAEDILQDAWLVLLEKLASKTLAEMPNKLTAYMLSVCDKKAHEYLRKRSYENLETSLDDESLTPERIESLQREIQTWEDFIEESARERERRLDAIDRALKTLSPRQRALLEGYYFDKKSMRELAEQLGYSSEDVAKTVKNRIMKTVRATVKQQERAGGLSPAAILKVIVGDTQKLPEFGRKGYIGEPDAVAEQRGDGGRRVACDATADARHEKTQFGMCGGELSETFHSAS